MINVNLLLCTALIFGTISAGDWGKKQNTGTPEERIKKALSGKRPVIKTNISATLLDRTGCTHKVSELLVDGNQLYFWGKKGDTWCKLEPANLESISMTQAQGSNKGSILISEGESETPLLKIFVKEKNNKDISEYLVHPDTLFSGKSEDSGILKGLYLNKLEKITISNVLEAKLSSKLQKLTDSLDKKEDLEEEEHEPSAIMKLFGFGKSKVNSVEKTVPTTNVPPCKTKKQNASSTQAKKPQNKLSLKYLTFSDLSAEGKDAECSVCQESYFETKGKPKKEQLVKTPCNHYFHAICLHNWLSKSDHPNCPNCRHLLKTSKKKI